MEGLVHEHLNSHILDLMNRGEWLEPNHQKRVLSQIVRKSYQLGLPLCNVPHGKDGLDVNLHRQGSCSSGESRQHFHYGFKTARMASITQNFESHDSFLNVMLGNRLDQQVVDGLLKAEKIWDWM